MDILNLRILSKKSVALILPSSLMKVAEKVQFVSTWNNEFNLKALLVDVITHIIIPRFSNDDSRRIQPIKHLLTTTTCCIEEAALHPPRDYSCASPQPLPKIVTRHLSLSLSLSCWVLNAITQSLYIQRETKGFPQPQY